MKRSNSTVLVTPSRELQESEADPDFDPSVISQMSATLREKMDGNAFKSEQDRVPIERFVPEKPKKCRCWRKLCCCCCWKNGRVDAAEGGEDSTEESTMYVVASRTPSATSVDPYVAGSTVPGVRASMNIHKHNQNYTKKSTASSGS